MNDEFRKSLNIPRASGGVRSQNGMIDGRESPRGSLSINWCACDDVYLDFTRHRTLWLELRACGDHAVEAPGEEVQAVLHLPRQQPVAVCRAAALRARALQKIEA